MRYFRNHQEIFVLGAVIAGFLSMATAIGISFRGNREWSHATQARELLTYWPVAVALLVAVALIALIVWGILRLNSELSALEYLASERVKLAHRGRALLTPWRTAAERNHKHTYEMDEQPMELVAGLYWAQCACGEWTLLGGGFIGVAPSDLLVSQAMQPFTFDLQYVN